MRAAEGARGAVMVTFLSGCLSFSPLTFYGRAARQQPRALVPREQSPGMRKALTGLHCHGIDGFQSTNLGARLGASRVNGHEDPKGLIIGLQPDSSAPH